MQTLIHVLLSKFKNRYLICLHFNDIIPILSQRSQRVYKEIWGILQCQPPQYPAVNILLPFATKFPACYRRGWGVNGICTILKSYLLTIKHCCDVIMSTIASQITRVSIICSIVCSGADQRKYQSSASLAFVRGIHRWPVNSPHKGLVTQKMFPFDDVIMNKLSLRTSMTPKAASKHLP